MFFFTKKKKKRKCMETLECLEIEWFAQGCVPRAQSQVNPSFPVL